MSIEQNVTRKLRAILSADVKGYSILMADDEAFTIKTIKEYRRIMSNHIELHNGRVVDSPGDNILAEFASAVNAVQCSVEIQKQLKEENDRLVEDKRLEFRIGVNIGDIVQDDDRIYGDGVNIASRIEGLADPSGICVSRSAYDQIKKKLGFGFEYLGEHPVKNIKDPVRVYKVLLDSQDSGKMIGEKKKSSTLKWIFVAVAISIVFTVGTLGGLYWKYFYLPTPVDIDPENEMAFDLPKGPSIAVLPLDNMTGNPEQEFFCDGFTENIISALSAIPNLFVIARNSTFAYKGKSINAQQVGHELGAQYLIEGSIQESTNRIRITIQLIETKTGHHKWSEVYDREIKDIFALQDDITLSILKAINLKIAAGERFQTLHKKFNNLHIYFKFLKVDDLGNQFTRSSNLMAQKELHEIVKLDPNISYAYSSLAACYIMDLWYGVCDPPIICLAKATEAIKKAFSLNESDYIAYMAAANLSLMRREYDNSIIHIKKALAINPNGAGCYVLYGHVLNCVGRPKEAIGFIKKGILLNPIPYFWYYSTLAHIYADLGQYNKAIKIFKQSIETKPNALAYTGLARAYVHMGYEIKANEATTEVLRLSPGFSIKLFLKVFPYKDQDRITSLAADLRKAGLPE